MFYTFLPSNHYFSRKMRLNGIRQTGRRWGVFLNSNNPLLNGIKQTGRFFLISFFSNNNGFRENMCRTSKIDLFILHNFCRNYFFSRSIFIDIKWKNLLKTFFFSNFVLENQICGYFHHRIRNQRLKISEYSEFRINRR